MFTAIKTFFSHNSQESFSVPKKKQLIRKLSAEELLTPHEDQLNEIREIVGLTPEHFEVYYREPIKRYAAFIQLSPASELHHHAHVGGMLEHNMDVVINALRIRRGQILPPGISAEDIERKKDIWTYAVFVSALLHDVGKFVMDFYFIDEKGRSWNPLSTHDMPNVYEVRYKKNRVHKLHERVPMLVLHKIIDEKALEWLSSDDLVLQNLVNYLSGNYSGTPVISEIVQKADQLSVADNLGGDVKKVAASTQERPLHERFLHTVKTLLSEGALPLNRKGAAAYTQDDRVYFVSKRLLDEVKNRMRKDGQSIPSRNDRMMDELQQFKVIVSNGDRAIWRCRIKIDDWEQNLSVLCFEMNQVWPDLNDRPVAPDNQFVEPVDDNNESLEPKSNSLKESVKEKNPEPVKKEKHKVEPVKPLSDVKEEANIGDLDDLLSPPEEGADLLDEYSDYADEDLMAYEAANGEPIPKEKKTEPGLSESASETKERDVVSSKEALLQEINEAASKGRSNTVAYHNAKVAKQADIQVEFDDPNCPAAQFIHWLVDGVSSAKIPTNSPANQVHFVDAGLFIVSPAIFKTFEGEKKISWKVVQRDLTRKKLNLKTQTGENIFKYEILSKTGRNSKRVIKGMLIPDPQKIGLKSSQRNEFLKMINE